MESSSMVIYIYYHLTFINININIRFLCVCVLNKQTNKNLGADSVHNYNQIIRQLIYFNRKPAYYLNRAFKLTCSELNGRFTSNDYIQTLTVIHPKIEPIESRQLPQAGANNIIINGNGNGNGINNNKNNNIQPFAAHARINEHKIELKEPLIKSSSGFFDNTISVDPNESFVRATPSTSNYH